MFRPRQSNQAHRQRQMTLLNSSRLPAGCLRTANLISAAIPPLAVPLTCHERVSPRYQHSFRDATPRPDASVSAWLRRQANETLFVSVVTMGELRRGITLLTERSSRRAELERMIHEKVPSWFQDRILPVTRTIAERWGVLDGERQLAGRPLNIADGMIAATALEHGLTLVTRNMKDFAGLGLALLNPWDTA